MSPLASNSESMCSMYNYVILPSPHSNPFFTAPVIDVDALFYDDAVVKNELLNYRVQFT